MRKFVPLVVVLLSLVFAASVAQAATRLGDACDLAVVGASDTAAFLHFDIALRAAVTRHDAAALARLVDFPVRVNYPGGRHVTANDAAALQQRLDGPALQALDTAVMARPAGGLFCNDNGVMYGDGALWVNLAGHGKPQAFRITAINLPAGAGDAPAAPQLGFDLDITLTPRAAQRLKATHEGITVSASYYGDPKPAYAKRADEVGHIDLGGDQIKLPGHAGRVHVAGDKVKRDRLGWISGGARVNVNVFSSRRSGPDNILQCDFIDGAVATVIKARPVTLHCGLIAEHPDTERKP